MATYIYTPNNNKGNYQGRDRGRGSHCGGRGQQSHGDMPKKTNVKPDQVNTSVTDEGGRREVINTIACGFTGESNTSQLGKGTCTPSKE